MSKPTTSDIRSETYKILNELVAPFGISNTSRVQGAETKLTALFKSHLDTIIEGLPEPMHKENPTNNSDSKPTTSDIRDAIMGIFDNPENPEYCLEDLISEQAIDQIVALFKSHLDTIIEGLPKARAIGREYKGFHHETRVMTNHEIIGFNAALTQITNQIKEYRSSL